MSIDCIPLPNVSSPVLEKILQFFTDRLRIAREITDSTELENEDAMTDEQRESLWFRSMKHVQEHSTHELLEILTAANYLHCDPLIDLISSVIAFRISGKSRDEMREILGIVNDFSEEEEKAILEESSWAFS